MNTLQLAHATPFYWPTILVAALVSAAVSIIGYWQNARAKRQDRQRQLFAEAFRSVMEYREFAYRVRRRPPETDRSAITDALSDVQAQLNLHIATLEIEAPSVARHYTTLVSETRRVVGPQIAAAWEQPPPTSDADMSMAGIDLTELGDLDAPFIRASNKHLRRLAPSSRSTALQQPYRSSEPFEETAAAPATDAIYENSIDDSSFPRLVWTLFGWWGTGVSTVTLVLGMWLSMICQDRLSAALGDLIIPAAVMISSAIAIVVWIAGPQRPPRPGERVTNPHDLLGIAWTFSYFAIVGISMAVVFRALPSDVPDPILLPIGGFASASMGLVMVGLVRLLLLTLMSVSRRLPEAPSLSSDRAS